MTTITLDLPQELYQRAANTAEVSHRSIEQVVVEWIQPPMDDEQAELQRLLVDLDTMSDAELTQIAQLWATDEETERLAYLFELQRQRSLTQAEHQEVEHLVYQEDLRTLRKAKALYLLKQRGALPATLAAELGI